MLEVVERLKESFVERDSAVEALVVGTIARKNVVLLGPPGTGKTMLVRAFGRLMGWTDDEIFSVQLNQFSTPDEVFGPVSLAALERDEYRRIGRGYLPTAKIAYLDEAFKANSAILNALLSTLQERRWFDGTQWVDVPLETAVVTSNEAPDVEEELGALWDRFLIRLSVGYLKSVRNLRTILKNPPVLDDFQPLPDAQDRLKAVREQAEEVVIPKSIIKSIVDIRLKLEWPVSDRRVVQSLDVLRARAALYGRQKVTKADLIVLSWLFWVLPEQEERVVETIEKIANAGLYQLREFRSSLQEMKTEAAELANMPSDQQILAVSALVKKLKDLQLAVAKADPEVTSTRQYRELVDEIAEFRRQMAAAILGDQSDLSPDQLTDGEEEVVFNDTADEDEEA